MTSNIAVYFVDTVGDLDDVCRVAAAEGAVVDRQGPTVARVTAPDGAVADIFVGSIEDG